MGNFRLSMAVVVLARRSTPDSSGSDSTAPRSARESLLGDAHFPELRSLRLSPTQGAHTTGTSRSKVSRTVSANRCPWVHALFEFDGIRLAVVVRVLILQTRLFWSTGMGNPASASSTLIIKVLQAGTGDLFGTGSTARRTERQIAVRSRRPATQSRPEYRPLLAASPVPRHRC